MNNLRNTIIITILSFSAMISGQSYLYQAKLYSSNLDAFTGLWEYKTSSESFRILLKKGNINTKLSLGECIIGDYYFQSNGILKDTYNETKIPSEVNDLNQDQIIIYANNGRVNEKHVDKFELYMYFSDKQFNKKAFSCRIKFISPTQIRWILADDEGPVDSDFIPGFSIPTDVILTKVQ